MHQPYIYACDLDMDRYSDNPSQNTPNASFNYPSQLRHPSPQYIIFLYTPCNQFIASFTEARVLFLERRTPIVAPSGYAWTETGRYLTFTAATWSKHEHLAAVKVAGWAEGGECLLAIAVRPKAAVLQMHMWSHRSATWSF